MGIPEPAAIPNNNDLLWLDEAIKMGKGFPFLNTLQPAPNLEKIAPDHSDLPEYLSDKNNPIEISDIDSRVVINMQDIGDIARHWRENGGSFRRHGRTGKNAGKSL